MRAHLRLRQRSNNRHEDGKAATIISDTGAPQDGAVTCDFDVGTLGEHRVEVSRNDHARPWSSTDPNADDVPDFVDAHMTEPQLLKSLPQHHAASALLEGRRGNLAKSDLIVYGLPLGPPGDIESRLDAGISEKI
jgi:hypothetical protein